jgi:hypothetical protein
MIRQKSLQFFRITLLLVLLTSTACSSPTSAPLGKENPVGIVAVDRTFREYYQSIGGIAVLGYPIMEKFDWHNYECQYTEKALMCFNPLATSSDRFMLYPLANSFEFSDPTANDSSPVSGTSGQTAIEIYQEFQPLYQKIDAGAPLTPVRYNPLERRIEQYFERAGFYRKIDAPFGEIKLLAYGSYICGDQCQFQPDAASTVSNLTQNIELPFLPVIARMSGTADFGEPLTRPFTVEDGQTMQVFENVVLTGYPQQPETVRLLNISRRTGVEAEQPGPQTFDLSNNVVFYNVEGPLGYHVPLDFDKFIVEHGGREYSGNPLEAYYSDGNTIRQCFENYCLDYIPSEPQGKKVKMVPLGARYLNQLNLQKELLVHPIYTAGTIALQVQERAPSVAADETQEIELMLTSTEDGQPVQHMEGSVQITLPDGSQRAFKFEPTGQDGSTVIKIPAQNQVPNGKIISYNICLDLMAENNPYCVQDSYLIWHIP